ncbi:MAG: CapA family protein [Roseburia sp.]|nr:CapA family protein [Roseburia sp.]
MARNKAGRLRRRAYAYLGGLICVSLLTGCGDDKALETVLPVLAQPEELYPQEDREEAGTQKESPEEPVGEKASETGGDFGVEAPAQPEEQSEEQSDTVTITISAAGDCSLGNYLEQDYAWSFCQTYEQQQDDGYFLENVSEIFSQDDLTIVNLEGVLTLSEEINAGRTYNIKGDPAYTGILTSGSVEAVSMGNNHRLDYGEAGTADTVAALQEAGIVYAYDGNVGMFEVKDIRIGIVSVNESSQGVYVENFLEKGIAGLREEGADLILACCHWGVEREYYPEDYQRTLGQKCIDWGADLVIGHHPHVLQGIEEYQGKYILYSLGNFCFGANRNPSDKDTMIFQQTFTFREGEKQQEASARVIPCFVSSLKERNDYKPTPAQGEEAARIISRLNELGKDFNVEVDAEGFLRKR